MITYKPRYFLLLVEWPFGTYTLVKPISGCPPGWWEGWTFQDNEDSHNSNQMPIGGHHFAGIKSFCDDFLKSKVFEIFAFITILKTKSIP